MLVYALAMHKLFRHGKVFRLLKSNATHATTNAAIVDLFESSLPLIHIMVLSFMFI